MTFALVDSIKVEKRTFILDHEMVKVSSFSERTQRRVCHLTEFTRGTSFQDTRDLHLSGCGDTHYLAGMSQVTSHPLALLKLMDESYESTGQPPLGIARHVGVESSTFNLPAHKILQALITHAQSPETIAKELLIELGKCGNGLVETLGLLLR